MRVISTQESSMRARELVLLVALSGCYPDEVTFDLAVPAGTVAVEVTTRGRGMTELQRFAAAPGRVVFPVSLVGGRELEHGPDGVVGLR